MAITEGLAERLEGKGWIGIGLGAVVLAPFVLPALARGLRPVAKGAVKGYLSLADRTRSALAECNEQIQDLVAEARSEHETRPNGQGMMTMEADGDRTASLGPASDLDETADGGDAAANGDEPERDAV